MPWHKVRGHSKCSSGWAVVKDDDGEVVGCHTTAAEADDQLAALYASERAGAEAEDFIIRRANDGRFAPATGEGKANKKKVMRRKAARTDVAKKRQVRRQEADVDDVIELGGKPNPGTPRDRRLSENRRPCPSGQHRMPNGDCMPDDEMSLDVELVDDEAEAELPEGRYVDWEGTLVIEGVETGDGREFMPGSLEWPDPEQVVLPLQWQERSKPHHEESTVVGRISTIERRDDGQIWGEGIILADAVATQQLRDGLAGGISIDVDSVKNADVELVFGDPKDDDVDSRSDVVTLFGPPPDKSIYHRGRLRGATLVALPAFVEAQIRLVDEGDALVAAGFPVHPPQGWFADPGFDGPTPWRIGDDGRVTGHLALWASCHQTFPNRCITPPREHDYPYFMRGELKTDDGELVGVGPITMRTGHASNLLGARPAAEHYDNTGTAVVDVAVGKDRFGIWVAGALRPGVTDAQLRELRGAALSGDWRRIGGQLRLVAILAVNVPGFPIPKMRAQVDGDGWSSLVAAGIVTEERALNVREALAHVDDDGTIRVRRVTLGAVGSHDTTTVEGTWDSGANERRLPSPMSAATARRAYAWIAPGASGEVQKTDGKFIHHNVGADGAPGAANSTACSSGIGVLNGGRGGTSIPAADRRGVYDHLAAHLRDAGREPPPLQ